jgi:UDP:flavonoid glycosyltransferase YjiC (YdhE family)
VRREKPYEVPAFPVGAEWPLVYLSFGSLGSGDLALMQRLIEALGRFPCRALVNVGANIDRYDPLPPNVQVAGWFPQPSVIPQVDAVVHHGGNNSFTECLYFGKPAVVIPFAWDGHDNATRAEETGFGFRLERATWTEAMLHDRLRRCLEDREMHARLAANSAFMKSQDGPAHAAALLERLL